MIIEIYYRRKIILKLNKIILFIVVFIVFFLGYNSVIVDIYNNY